MSARILVGRNVRHHRLGRGLSQEQLAFTAGLDRAYVGRVERGGENVTIATLEALAKALGVGIERLFAARDPKAPQPKPLKAGRKPKAETSR